MEPLGDSLPVRARTVLAAARGVEVRALRPGGSPHQPVAVAADDDGDVYLLEPLPGDWSGCGVEVRWRPRDPRAGELVLTGRTWGALPLAEVPALAAALVPGCPAGARACRSCPARPVDLGSLGVVPVVADRLRLDTVVGPAAGRSLEVPVALFRGSRPDAWAVERSAAAEHLERDHQRELRALVGTVGAVGAVGGPAGAVRASAVSVRSLDDDGIVLTCLTGDGVTDVVLPFGTPVRTREALAAWLRRHTPG